MYPSLSLYLSQFWANPICSSWWAAPATKFGRHDKLEGEKKPPPVFAVSQNFETHPTAVGGSDFSLPCMTKSGTRRLGYIYIYNIYYYIYIYNIIYIYMYTFPSNLGMQNCSAGFTCKIIVIFNTWRVITYHHRKHLIYQSLVGFPIVLLTLYIYIYVYVYIYIYVNMIV